MSLFQFKQFSIKQDKTAMKVGTDGVLLGAWAEVGNAQNILDVGTGTGLVALMLAQRNEQAKITAIEINQNAFEQAKENISESPFSKKIEIFHIDFLNYSTTQKFDVIVSNPPYFNNTFQAENVGRNQARQNSSLPFRQLVEKTKQLLSAKGKANFIIPYQEEECFLQYAAKENLFPYKITHIKGHQNAPIKRSLLCLQNEKSAIEKSMLCIEKSRHNYTADYIELTKDFYLKF